MVNSKAKHIALPRFIQPLARGDIYDRIFAGLLVASVILRVIWLDIPTGSLIFDETYYVNVARIIVGLPYDEKVYANAVRGLDPNREHPPLAKMMIAASTWLFGNNGYGWRLPSIAFGIVSLIVFYLLIKRLSKSKLTALIASFLFSFDNLIFAHSRIATLDIFLLGFILIGFYFYFAERHILSAISLSLATLSKIGGLYALVAIILFHLARNLRGRVRRKLSVALASSLQWIERYLLVYGLSFLGLLAISDRIVVGYSNPFEHLQFISNYTFSLIRDVPAGIESYPWQWLLNEVKIHYLTVNVNVIVDGTVTRSFPSIDFIGAMNPLIVYLTIPAMLYSVFSYHETRDELPLFTLLWFTATYLPFLPLSIFGHRIMYIFYFLVTVPSVCTAIAHMIVRENPPRIIAFIYFGAVILGFWTLFPFRTIPG